MDKINNKKSQKIVDRILIGYEIYKYMKTHDILKEHIKFFLFIFVRYVSLDHYNCPKENQIKVLEKATEIAQEMELGVAGELNDFIYYLRTKEYDKLEYIY